MKPVLRRCIYCGHRFRPDPRTAHQKACRGKRCRAKRRRDAQAHWVHDNPDYFKGRYPDIKRWLGLKKHRGYLRGYRAEHPEYVAADNRARRGREKRQRQRADIQDAMPRREISRLRTLEGADIQDTIRRRLDGLLTVLAAPLPPIYKTLSTPPAPLDYHAGHHEHRAMGGRPAVV